MTCAPILRATSGVPSEELLSTTMTSVTSSEGRSANTRPMASASLWVGIMTETRTRFARHHHRDVGLFRARNASMPQLRPNPGRAPFGDPQTAEKQKRDKSSGPRQQADQ